MTGKIRPGGKRLDLSAAQRRERLRQLAKGIPPHVIAFLDALADAALDHVLRAQAGRSAMKRAESEQEGE
jgi:hypothetical protein